MIKNLASDWLKAAPEITQMINGSQQMRNIRVSWLIDFDFCYNLHITMFIDSE